jgi:hypothetical protein
MKKCPKCNADVDDNFDLCWNCQYSFFEEKVLGEDDFKLICAQCNAEVESGLQFCPHCHSAIELGFDNSEAKEQIPKQMSCLRCQVPLDFKGNFRFHEGTRMGAFGDLFELFTNRESFDLYCCPNCGKVEFFLPGYN